MLPYTDMINYLSKIDLPTIKNNKKVEFYNIEGGFDIETTSVKVVDDKRAFMYVWQFGIGYQNRVFYGRTWIEFVDLCEQLSEYLDLSENKRLVIYVHNLGYEFQFMRKYFDWLDVFSASERKPIKALCSLGIEFRDSFILSGYSLENTAKNLAKHKIKKMVGDLDYSLTRTSKTPLNNEEINYCINDIQIILAYINEQIEYSGDISKIPMTNTGRVRKYVRDACYIGASKKGRAGRYLKYRKIMEDLTLDTETYNQLKRAFMGGFTHANANYVGDIIENVTSIDFTSSYPSVMVSEKFPMSRFKNISCETVVEFEKLAETYALIFDVRFINLRPAIKQENYISASKCRDLINPVINNGRISSADSLLLTMTEIDYSIMKQAYDWDEIEIGNMKRAYKAYLPKAICESILKLYQGKTELKDVQGSEVEYLLSKGMLNSIYGMSVTNVVKDNAIYDDHSESWDTETPETFDEIQKYNSSRNRFLYYAWGIWVTAYARRNLWTGIIDIGDDYIYSDTDSLKLLNYENHLPYIEWFDAQIINKMTALCKHHKLDVSLLNPKTQKGVTKMMGVWDYEGTYDRFKTLGAKRYLYQDGDKMQLTVAGLSKRNGLNYMIEQTNNDPIEVLKMFDDSLHIPASKTGKMTHTYLDLEQSFTVTDYLGVTADVLTLSGVHLEICDFTLSMSEMQKTYLSNLKLGYSFTGVSKQ
jgi:hypothetical protein